MIQIDSNIKISIKANIFEYIQPHSMYDILYYSMVSIMALRWARPSHSRETNLPVI